MHVIRCIYIFLMFRCNRKHRRRHQHTLKRFAESIIYSKLSYLFTGTQKHGTQLCADSPYAFGTVSFVLVLDGDVDFVPFCVFFSSPFFSVMNDLFNRFQPFFVSCFTFLFVFALIAFPQPFLDRKCSIVLNPEFSLSDF